MLQLTRTGKLKLSKDGGSTWSDLLKATDDDPAYVDVDITSDGTVYAIVGGDWANGTLTNKSGVFRSTDDGTTWADITPANFSANYGRVLIDISESNEKVVYFLMNKAYFEDPGITYLWKYTYVSGDGSGAGGTWEGS